MPKLKNSVIAVYKYEEEAGLADKIRSTASIAYVTQLQNIELTQEVAHAFLKSKANNIDDQFDLLYLTTILVTTGWNKNDDVFGPEEVWNARYTPANKQFNLGHDQSKIIGHMINSKPVNEKYELISDDTTIDNLPAKFHLLTGAVVYKVWENSDFQEKMDKIFEEIAEGKWFVSMEALFRGFNYAITDKQGNNRVVARDENSAFLTKHLRAYGGSGTYEDFRVGRFLKNITFSGKGLVENPANPESIIFPENSDAFRPISASVGYLTLSENKDGRKLEQDLNNITTKTTNNSEVVMADEKNKDTSNEANALTAANAKLSELEKTNQGLVEAASAAQNKIASLENTVKEKDKKIGELETSVADYRNKYETVIKEINQMKADELVRARTALLTAKNAPADEAKSIVETFKNLDDVAFAMIVELSAAKWVKAAPSENGHVNSPAQSAAQMKTVSEVVEEPEPEPSLTVQTNEEVEPLRASLASYFASILNQSDDDEEDNNK